MISNAFRHLQNSHSINKPKERLVGNSRKNKRKAKTDSSESEEDALAAIALQKNYMNESWDEIDDDEAADISNDDACVSDQRALPKMPKLRKLPM